MLIIYLMSLSKIDAHSVIDKVKHLIKHCNKNDIYEVNISDINRQIVLMESQKGWSEDIEFIKQRYKVDPLVIAIGSDFLRVKQNIFKAGGILDSNTYTDFNEMKRICAPVSEHEAISIIKNMCVKSNRKHLIYKATTPSGKIYIGKTMTSMENRIRQHVYYANNQNKEWPFSKAIRKYGIDNIVFKVEKIVFGSEAANQEEKKLILKYQSNHKTKGYNATGGGEGRSWLIDELEENRRRNISNALKKPESKKLLSDKSKNSWQNPEIKAKRYQNIKKARSSEESRAKTSRASRKWYSEGDGRKKISESNIVRYSNPEARIQQSLNSREKRAKPFECRLLDGTLIAVFRNNMEAAEKLNIPQCGISSVLNGRFRQTRGYVFKYISDPIDNTTGGINDCSNNLDQRKEAAK